MGRASDSGAYACPPRGEAVSWGLWLQDPVGPRYSPYTLVCGVWSLALWWVSGGGCGLRGLKAACLIVSWTVSPPSYLLGLRHPSTGASRLLGRGGPGS